MSASAAKSLTRGRIVAIGRDLDTTVINPTESETPVQDALDTIADAGGRIYLPPGIVRDRGPVRPHPNTGIYGFGMNVSVLKITQPNTDGIRFDRSQRANRVQLDGFELRGPGSDAASGVAIHFRDNGTDPVSDPADFTIGRLYCWAWNNTVYRVDEGVGPFQCRHDFLRMDDCDAGDAEALIEWRSTYGPANWFGTIVAYPSATQSGTNSDLLYQRGGELSIGDITTGTTTGRLVDTQNGRLHVGRLHYEPVGQRTVPQSLVRIGRNGATRFDDVLVDSEAVQYVYELGEGAGNAVLFGPAGGRGTVRRNVVNVSGQLDADRSSWYFGRVADVDVTGSSGTGSLRVMGTAGQGRG
ncbi:hypothetical protein EWF95_04760 [Halonotius roseus]|uniref:Pectate lyase superfamily protein domain-containing protein n=2 Tax=Halonotius roseus TaxID=2511997 RepID=A0A544QSU1_9EURY|nr:hypothetical protein EWF95_04760 [Halonotius roseus]